MDCNNASRQDVYHWFFFKNTNTSATLITTTTSYNTTHHHHPSPPLICGNDTQHQNQAEQLSITNNSTNNTGHGVIITSTTNNYHTPPPMFCSTIRTRLSNYYKQANKLNCHRPTTTIITITTNVLKECDVQQLNFTNRLRQLAFSSKQTNQTTNRNHTDTALQWLVIIGNDSPRESAWWLCKHFFVVMDLRNT